MSTAKKPVGRPRKPASPDYPKRRANLAPPTSEPVAEVAPQVIPNTTSEAIGLSSDPPIPKGIAPIDEDTYRCKTCLTSVEKYQAKCTTCEIRLEWVGV